MAEKISSPIKGKVVYLENVQDPVFSQKLLGDGIAILPEWGFFGGKQQVCSPISGEVVMLFETQHAVGLLTEAGTEILIHIGIDTVNLNGVGFSALVKVGEQVRNGTPLIEVDFKKISKAGYDPTTLVIATNKTVDALLVPENNITQATPLYSIM